MADDDAHLLWRRFAFFSLFEMFLSLWVFGACLSENPILK